MHRSGLHRILNCGLTWATLLTNNTSPSARHSIPDRVSGLRKGATEHSQSWCGCNPFLTGYALYCVAGTPYKNRILSMQQSTLKKLSEVLGLSISTVSRAL